MFYIPRFTLYAHTWTHNYCGNRDELLAFLIHLLEKWNGEYLACWHQLSCCWMVITPCNLPPPWDLRSGSTPKFPANCHLSNSIQNPFLPRLLGTSLLSLPSHFSSSSPPLLSKDLLPHLITGFLGLWPLWRLWERGWWGGKSISAPLYQPLLPSSHPEVSTVPEEWKEEMLPPVYPATIPEREDRKVDPYF